MYCKNQNCASKKHSIWIPEKGDLVVCGHYKISNCFYKMFIFLYKNAACLSAHCQSSDVGGIVFQCTKAQKNRDLIGADVVTEVDGWEF